MHYSAGFGTVVAFGTAHLAPGGSLWATIARLLLDAAGLLFAVYLIAVLTLALAGVVLRHRARRPDPGPRHRAAALADHAPHHPAGLDAARLLGQS